MNDYDLSFETLKQTEKDLLRNCKEVNSWMRSIFGGRMCARCGQEIKALKLMPGLCKQCAKECGFE